MKMNLLGIVLGLAAFSGCASLGIGKLEVPPEFHQKIQLQVSENYTQHQATRSSYDVGDLQSFHTQHSLPIVIEDAFRDMFDEVEMIEADEPSLEMASPDVPAIFEVRILDLANDIYNESQDYRAEVTLAVAMKSPNSDQVFWQKAFRGSGYVKVDPQWQTGLGPQDAVIDAMRDAIDQMQRAIINEPQVRLQLQHYKSIEAARQRTDQSASSPQP